MFTLRLFLFFFFLFLFPKNYFHKIATPRTSNKSNYPIFIFIARAIVIYIYIYIRIIIHVHTNIQRFSMYTSYEISLFNNTQKFKRNISIFHANPRSLNCIVCMQLRYFKLYYFIKYSVCIHIPLNNFTVDKHDRLPFAYNFLARFTTTPHPLLITVFFSILFTA